MCAGLTPIATKTRVLILQHPRERDVGIGTARIARLALASAVLRCDVDFAGDEVVRSLLADGNAHLLFPGPNAVDVETARFPSPITLVVLDGTWWQAEKILKSNPFLAALPRLRMTPAAPSTYGRIRREPAEHCVATLEAIAHVLGHLEDDRDRFASLLGALAKMVNRQLYFATEVAAGRQKPAQAPRPKRDPMPALLRQRGDDLVCVHGEANAWPNRHPERAPAETVHWLARRCGSGETFASVLAPRGRIAPGTCRHIRLSFDELQAGESWDDFAKRFRDFLRPTDILVSWGHFPLATLVADGFTLTHERLDLRTVASHVLRQRTGTVEECASRLGLPSVIPWTVGRGGERLAWLCGVTEKLRAWPAVG